MMGRDGMGHPRARIDRRSAHADTLGRIAVIVGVFTVVLSWLTPFVAPLALVGFALAVIAVLRAPLEREVAWWGFALNLAALVCCFVWGVWLASVVEPSSVIA